MAGRLEGRSTVVTGAGCGIGRATSRLFAQEGAKVVCFDRAENVHGTAAMIVEAGGTALAVTGDAGDEASAARRKQMAESIRADQPARFSVALLADAAKTVTGQIFGSSGENIILYSQPRPIQTESKAEGWTIETILSEALPAMKDKLYPLARLPLPPTPTASATAAAPAPAAAS